MNRVFPVLMLALGLVAGSSIGVAYANGIITFDGDFLLNGDFFCDGCVDTPEIAEGAVDSLRILDGEVKSIDIGDGELQTEDYGFNSITNRKLADFSIEPRHLFFEVIREEHLITGAVTEPKIADGTIALKDLSSPVRDNLLSMSTFGPFDVFCENDCFFVRELIPDDGNSLCFLTEVRLADIDDEFEFDGCKIFSEDGLWKIFVTTTMDAVAECEARCFSWSSP